MARLNLDISKEDARTVLEDPGIVDCISADNMDGWEMPDGPIYLCGYVCFEDYEPEVIGCFILHEMEPEIYECHVQVLPQYRIAFSEAFGEAVIDWTWDNTNAKELQAQIPILYPNVKEFAEKMGFEVIKVIPNSHTKNGKTVDQWHLRLKNGLH